MTPTFVMPWLYAPRAERLAEGGEIHYHAMAKGGLGRTDRIVESYLPMLDEARANGEKVRLMGHSLGGVVAWALAHECGDVVDTVEVWGAPLRGTGMASFFRHFAAEARFLSPMSRWLERYNRPLDGPRGRSMYTALDLLVQPPRQSCYVEGEPRREPLHHPARSAPPRPPPGRAGPRGPRRPRAAPPPRPPRRGCCLTSTLTSAA